MRRNEFTLVTVVGSMDGVSGVTGGLGMEFRSALLESYNLKRKKYIYTERIEDFL